MGVFFFRCVWVWYEPCGGSHEVSTVDNKHTTQYSISLMNLWLILIKHYLFITPKRYRAAKNKNFFSWATKNNRLFFGGIQKWLGETTEVFITANSLVIPVPQFTVKDELSYLREPFQIIFVNLLVVV